MSDDIQEKASVTKKAWFSRKNADSDEKPAAKVIEVEEKVAEPIIPSVSFGELFRYSTKFELFIDVIGFVAALAAGAAQPVMTTLFSNATQDFIEFGRVSHLAKNGNQTAIAEVAVAAARFKSNASSNALYLVYIGLGIFACTFVAMYIWVYTGEVNAKRIREKYLQAILRQDIAFFDNVGPGEIATRIQTDTHLVQQGISEKVAMFAQAMGGFFCGFIIAYIRSWRLALAMSSILPLIMITGAVMHKFMSKYMRQTLDYGGTAGTIAEEVISTIRTAQAFGTQKKLSDLYNIPIAKTELASRKSAAWEGAGLGVFWFYNYGSHALAFHFGTTLINKGLATPGEVISVVFAVIIGAFSLALLAPELEAIVHGTSAAAKLFHTIDRVPAIDSSDEGGSRPEKVDGSITLENINFSYPSRATVQVVQDLSLHFEAGKTAALVGASGSGKSTIISLVERFYDPTSGVVKVDGVDVKNLNLKWLRSQIGLVSQEPTLFATTIRGNVAHGLINTPYEHSSEEEKFALIKQACIKANADDFINNLPNGYETLVGERGFLLSGGQKQRVAIARAIVSDPRILLLDEATSALDTQSEGVVQDALDKASAGRTTITIAHRLSTIKDADVIHVMGNGRVLESGTHNALLLKDGAYAKLVYAQKLRDGKDKDGVADDLSEDSETTDGAIDKGAAKDIRRNSVASGDRNYHGVSAKGDFERLGLIQLGRRLAPIIRDHWKRYALGFVVALIGGGVYPSFGLVFAKGVEGFSLPTPDEKRIAGNRNGLYVFVVGLGTWFVFTASNYLFAANAAALTARLRMLSFKALLRQDIEYFDRDENSTGSLTANLSSNPQKVHGLAGVTLSVIVQACSTLTIGSIIGLAISWKIALVGIACMPIIVSPGYIRLRVVVMKDQADKKAHEESATLACEAASAIRTVAALTREEECLRLYSSSLEVPLKKSHANSIWSQSLFSFSRSALLFVLAITFWFGSRLVSSGEITIFQFFVGLMCTTFSAMEAGSVFTFVPDMSSATGAGSDIIQLLDSVPEIDAESDAGTRPDPTKVKGHIRFENVHFRYPTRPGVRVLKDLSLEVRPGTYIALVGASGSGKSTVIQLIERFYNPLSGEIYLDGERITDINVQEYRKQLALVSQEPTLYAGTVRFNILLGAIKPESEVTQEEIEDACRAANILEFIQSLPDGFDTEVGGKGSQMSGGQKQRIAIARALLRNPKVLLLDEATSALDSTSEKVVQEALDQAAKGRTTIAVAHRLSTIQNADRIYFIKDGGVSESGTHNELLAQRGAYYEYVQLQALSTSD